MPRKPRKPVPHDPELHAILNAVATEAHRAMGDVVEPIDQVFAWSPEVHHLMLAWFGNVALDSYGMILPIA